MLNFPSAFIELNLPTQNEIIFFMGNVGVKAILAKKKLHQKLHQTQPIRFKDIRDLFKKVGKINSLLLPTAHRVHFTLQFTLMYFTLHWMPCCSLTYCI